MKFGSNHCYHNDPSHRPSCNVNQLVSMQPPVTRVQMKNDWSTKPPVNKELINNQTELTFQFDRHLQWADIQLLSADRN